MASVGKVEFAPPISPELNARIEKERRDLMRLFAQAPMLMAVLRGPDHVHEMVNDGYMRLLGSAELIGRPAAELPALRAQGFIKLLDCVYTTGEPFVAKGMPFELPVSVGEEPNTIFIDFIYQPMQDAEGRITGIIFQGHDVTEHKRTVDALVRAQAYNKSILQASSDAVKLLDADGNIVFMSEASERALGCGREEAIGKPWSALWPADERASLDKTVEAARETGEGRCTARHEQPGRATTWWDTVVTMVPGREGVRAELLVVCRDITGRIDSQQRLRESEERYRHTVQVSSQVSWTADASGALAEIGNRWTEFTGMPIGSALGSGWLDALHPDDRAHTERDCAAAVATGDPLDTEFRVRTWDGRFEWVRCRAQARWNDEGAVVKWYGVVENIDAAKRADEALRQAEERFRLVARAATDAIWDWDVRSDRMEWSGTLHALFGHHENEELTGEWWLAQLHPADRDGVQRGLEAVLAGAQSHWSNEYRFRRADGSYAEVFDRGHVIRDEHGAGIRMVGAIQDLSERKATERKIRQMQNELIHVSRMSAMGAMASMLAHELNQPLTAVASYVKGGQRLIEARGAEALPDIESALHEAAAQALRAGEIVRRLRTMVSTGDVERKTEDVSWLVGEARTLALGEAADMDAICCMHVDPDADFVLCDRIQIQQVLVNLVRNAFEAFGNSPTREVAILARRRNRVIELRVEDSGPGVPPHIAEQLFQPFVTSKDGGMGVGLSICRTIIESHEGRLWVERSDLGGAAFCFTLKRVARPGSINRDEG